MNVQSIRTEVFLKELLMTRDAAVVGAKNSLTKFEGDIRKKGDTVRIFGLEAPDVTPYDGSELTFNDIDIATTQLVVDKAYAITGKLDLVDRELSEAEIIQEFIRKCGRKIAKENDKYIYEDIAKNIAAGNVVDGTNATSANIISVITNAQTKLWENDIEHSEELSLEVSPKMAQKLALAGIIHMTNNDGVFKNGYLGNLGQMCIYTTNQLYKENGFDYCVLRTKGAYAFASAINHIEEIQAEKTFHTLVKGLNIFGGKIIKPSEIVVIKFSAGTETTI